MQKKLRPYVHNKYRKMYIAEHDSDQGARIGGNPPEGVVPACINECTRYFATVPLNDDLTVELSIFISFDENRGENDPISYVGEIITSGIVQLVVHDARPRCAANYLNSEIPSKALLIEDEECLESEGFAEEYDHHKIGGLPAYEMYRDPLYTQVNNYLADGYSHIVQFAFPNHKDALFGGSWPFGEKIFHVFGKVIGGEIKLFSCWR